MTRENREIKFRGWDSKRERMLQPFLTFEKHPADGLVTETTNWHDENDMSEGWDVSNQVNELMQFTGKKDKTGVDAYEKDYDSEGNMIDWCDECCGYQFFQIDIPTKDVICCHNCEGNFMLQDHMKDFEIVGNIYENNSA